MRKSLFIFILIFVACSSNSNKNNQNKSIVFSLPNGSQCIDLFTTNMDTTKYYIREYMAGHGMIISSDTYMIMDDSIPCFYRFPFENDFNDIAWFDSNCFFAQDSTICYAESNGIVHTILRSDNLINRIWPIEKGIYFSTDSTLHFFRYSIAEAEPVIKVPGRIHELVPLSEHDCFIAADSMIVFLSEGKLFRVETDSSHIQALVMLPDGCLFFSSENNVFFLDIDGTKLSIVDKGARQLFIINDNLVIIFNDNSSVVLTDVSLFHKSIIDIDKYEKTDSISY